MIVEDATAGELVEDGEGGRERLQFFELLVLFERVFEFHCYNRGGRNTTFLINGNIFAVNCKALGLMSDEAGAINFEDEDVVDNADLLAIYELNLTLVAVGVNTEADAVTFINVAGLGEELDVEGNTLDFAGGLRVDVASDTGVGTRVKP